MTTGHVDFFNKNGYLADVWQSAGVGAQNFPNLVPNSCFLNKFSENFPKIRLCKGHSLNVFFFHILVKFQTQKKTLGTIYGIWILEMICLVFSETEVLQKPDSYKLGMKQRTQVWTGGQTGEHLGITLNMSISPLMLHLVFGKNHDSGGQIG